MNKSKIDWCDSTWNPVTGCLHGCKYCYARGIANRFGLEFAPKLGDAGMEGACKYDSPEGLDTMLELVKPYVKNGKVQPYPMAFYPTFHKYHLNDYIGKKGRNIFVCSMADLFGEWVPDSWIEEVFKACEKAPQHNYLFLTKNPERYVKLSENGLLRCPKNMWYGASVTDEKSLKKVADVFANMSCDTNTFLSVEPIFEDITLTETWNDCVLAPYMGWVIIGAETGRRKDKVIPDRAWIRSIYFDCYESWKGIPVFMKESLADIWGKPLIQEFPKGLKR